MLKRILLIAFIISSIVFILALIGISSTREPDKSYFYSTLDFIKPENPYFDIKYYKTHNIFSINTTITPDKARIDEDISLKVSIENISSPIKNGYLRIQLDAPSFESSISQDANIKLFIEKGEYIQYILTPKSTGNKKIKVNAKYYPPWYNKKIETMLNTDIRYPNLNNKDLPEKEQILNIEIYEKPTFIGFSKEALNIIQAISGILGFPAIILFFITNRSRKRKPSKRK